MQKENMLGEKLTEDTNCKAEMVEFPSDVLKPENVVRTYTAKGIGKHHISELDLFERHSQIPAHDQEALENAKIALIGGGGLNSWAGVALARSGCRDLLTIDYDRVEQTNLSRQFFFERDLGELKGTRLAKNLIGQAIGGAEITGIGLPFEQVVKEYEFEADLFVVGVDNNSCRRLAVIEARRRKIPAVFTMLSLDGMRCQTFLQGASADAPCLWCALPNLDPDKHMSCAAAIISSCFMASAFTTFFVHRTLMGWGEIEPFNWREADLTGITPSKIGNIKKRKDCTVCGDSAAT